jgi:hypothetical protein
MAANIRRTFDLGRHQGRVFTKHLNIMFGKKGWP